MRPRIVAIANQKGGVGKTTTAINLAATLSEAGVGVLLVDIDPQGNASTGLGIDAGDRRPGTYEVLLEGLPVTEAIRSTRFGVAVCPSNPDLSSGDVQLADRSNRIYLLRDALAHPDLAARGIQVILIDCPPSLNLLTTNALVAADGVLVPLQTEFFALEGLSQLISTVREVRRAANPALRIDGVVLTMHDSRNRLSQQVEADARGNLGELVMSTVIPRNIRLSEASSFGLPILAHDAGSRGASAYRAFAAEFLDRLGLAGGKRGAR